MGNQPSSGGVLGNSDHNYVVSIGKRASIVFRGREVGQERDGESKESWTIVYSAGMSNCVLTLSKMLGKQNTMMMTPPSQHDHEKLVIRIIDNSLGICNLLLNLQRDEAGLLHHTRELFLQNNGSSYGFTCTINAYGEITEKHIYIYGIGNRRGLVVNEWKKKEKDQNPYSGNMAHYFVCDEDGVDVGLSVAVKRIRVLANGSIDYVVNGPEMHPADALAYKIRQVERTQTWKPTDCPHCANKYILERQSDTESDADNGPPVPPQSQGRGGAFVSNPGRFKGKDMCNTYINRLYGRKWR